MRVIPPLTITDAMLGPITQAPEPASGEVVYSGGATYALGDEVISTTTHRKFESLQASNTGHALPVWPETENAWWLDIGPTNRWAMFDLLRNTQTEFVASPATVRIVPGERVDSLFLGGCEADSVRVQVEAGSSSPLTEYMDETFDMNAREVLDWYSYFFAPFALKPSLVSFDIPAYFTSEITLTLTRAGSAPKLGALVLGSNQYIGELTADANADALNFSKIERDEFGNSKLIPRRSAPKLIGRVVAERSLVKTLLNLRTALNASPAVWVGIEDEDNEAFEAPLVMGVYKAFPIKLADGRVEIDLEVEEI